ncbi:MAG TPA: histidinol-phosphate transaminase [Actinobacteria bacterium]|nr:histidinol-phosphate transaminase [Actinomycetota bacterium]
MSKIIQPRPELDSLKSYVPMEEDACVVLSANESPYNLPESLITEVKNQLDVFNFNRYPDALGSKLRKEIASHYGFSDENIVLGNGSDELIQCLLLAYGGKERSVFTFEPTFSMYDLISRATGTRVYELKRTASFDVDIPSALEVAKEFNPTIIFLCNPNNPTGNLVSSEDIEIFLKETGALIVVDEAYAEFSGQTVIPLIDKYPNLVVLRTFSKAFSLASLRIGYMLASPSVVQNTFKVKLPYNCGAFSQMVASLVFKNRDVLMTQIEKIVSERKSLIKELKKLSGVKVHPSSANFVLIRTENEASFVWKNLLEAGILVRDFKEPCIKDCLRITVGKGEENKLFLKALKEIINAG